MDKKYIGRVGHVESLRNLLLTDRPKNELVVQSIEGPGGIGKSTLLDYSLSRMDLSPQNFLILRLNGGDLVHGGVFPAIEKMVGSAKSSSNDGLPVAKYFVNTNKILKVYGKLKVELIGEIIKNENADAALLNTILDGAFSTGKALNDVLSFTKKYINFYGFEERRASIEQAFLALKALGKELPGVLQRLGVFDEELNIKNSLKENALKTLSDAFFSDLKAILVGVERQNLLKPGKRKILGVDRLLLIIDDYEKTQREIGEFLVSYLLDQLKRADFDSTLIVLGRDDIRNTHVGWDQHFSGNLLRAIRLNPLNREEMDLLVDSMGNFSEEEKDRAWDDTSGYPFLVNLWADEAENGGRTATSLKRFYDRTTRWMSEEEKKWLGYAIYMEDVNLSKFQYALKNEEEGQRAWKWFESEGSVRDTRSIKFKVNQYLRSRLIEYLELTDPHGAEALKQVAQMAANA